MRSQAGRERTATSTEYRTAGGYNASVATCSQCGTLWPTGYLACPADGTPLQLSDDELGETVHTVKLVYEAPRPTASRADIAPGTQIGEYVVERKVARGGMGAIYAARHPVLGRPAAIKVIHGELSGDASLLERFVREAQAVNLIRHPNIVDVFSIGALPDGRAYFVMDWLEGTSLAQRLERDRPLPLAEAAWILDEAIDALAAAHAAGVVHRDLKPPNIFLARQGAATRVVVLDFGIAKLSGGIREETATGILMGTPAYLAPEQARTSQVDHRADIYALGVVAFEMLAGRRPFSGGNLDSVVGKHVAMEAPPLADHAPGLPPAVASVVAAMMAKDPAARPGLDQVKRVLAPYLPRAAPAAPARRRWLIAAVLVGLAIGATVVGAAALGGSDQAASDAAPRVVAVNPRAADAAPPPPDAAAPGATLVIAVDRDDARIEVDGRLIAEATRQVTVEVAPGDHEVVVTPVEGAPQRRLVRAGSGATLAVDVRLRAERPAAKKPIDGKRRSDPQERVRALHAATGKLADQLVATRRDARARQLQGEYLAIPSPYTTSDPAELRAIETQLERIRSKLRAAAVP